MHLERILEILRANSLYGKLSKCTFAQDKVIYLGHEISASGISTDPEKIEAIRDWPNPKNIDQLRSFLGLAGYYQKFIRGFAQIAAPLTAMTKKNVTFALATP